MEAGEIVLKLGRRARPQRMHISLKAVDPIDVTNDQVDDRLSCLLDLLSRPNATVAAEYERVVEVRREVAAGVVYDRHDEHWSHAKIRIGTRTVPPAIEVTLTDGSRMVIEPNTENADPAGMSPEMADFLTDDDDRTLHVNGFEQPNDIVIVVGTAPQLEVEPGNGMVRLRAQAASANVDAAADDVRTSDPDAMSRDVF